MTQDNFNNDAENAAAEASAEETLDALQTNPFRVTGGSSEDADDATNKRKLAEQRQVVLKSFQTLQLQSIMYGEKNRSCLINNALYREGQTVNGFVIEKITSDNV